MWRSRLAAVAGTVLGVLLLSSGSAGAGGPTSVLIVSPGEGATSSLYTTDDDYHLLARALGEEPVADDDAPGWQPGRGPAGINVTWLVHDITVWRLDRVHVGADGVPWIHTQQSFDGAPDLTAQGVWHRSPHPDELLDLLDRLGVLGPGVALPMQDTAGRGTADDSVAAATPTTATAQGSVETSSAGSWTLPALAGGIVVGVLGDRLVRRRGDRGDSRRWELVDG